MAAASLWLRLAGTGQTKSAGHDHVIRIAAEARDRQHMAPDLVARRPGPDGVDVSRHLVARHQRRRRSVGVEAHSCEDVGEIHAGGPHADADLAWAGLGRRPLPLLHDFRAAVTGDDDFAHARDLLELRIIDRDSGFGIRDSGLDVADEGRG